MSIPVDSDVESTKIEVIEHDHSSTQTGGSSSGARNHWRQIILLFRVYLRLKYYNRATNIFITDPAYGDGYNNHVEKMVETRLDIKDPADTSLLVDDQSADIPNPDIHDEDNDDTSITTINDSNSSRNDIQEVLPLPTSISKETLIRILKERDFVILHDHGGVEGIAASLATNLENGISTDAENLRLRQAEYGTNTFRLQTVDPLKSFFHFLFRASKDFTIILLLCCAVLTLVSGLKEEGRKNGWFDGTILFITVFMLVSVTSFKNYLSYRKSHKLQYNKNNHGTTNVLREGLRKEVLVCEIVVGDLVFLSSGDWVPCDGLFVNGDNMKVNDGVLHHKLRISHVHNPFLYYGAQVIHGSGYMLVTSVGMNTTMGEMMSNVIHDTQRKQRPLQAQIVQMNTYLQSIGLFLGVLILIVLLLRYFRGKIDDETGYPDQISKSAAAGELMKAMERLVTMPRGTFASLTNVFAVLLVGLQEGLPLIVSLSLSYWNFRISKDHQVTICESFGATTLGSMTSLVINKATLNQMKVEIFCVGDEIISENSAYVISPEIAEMICDGVGALVLESDASSSPMEDPLLIPWAESNFGIDMELVKQSRSVLIRSPFVSDGRKSGSLLRKNEDDGKTLHLHWGGSAETILEMCSEYYNPDGIKNVMDDGRRNGFRQFITDMDNQGLRSMAFAFSTITEDAADDGAIENFMITELRENNLILLFILGLKGTCFPEGRRNAVDALRNTGVSIKLVSAGSLEVLKPIAVECEIFHHDQPDSDAIVLEGEEFRNFTDSERMEKVERISVMGSACPSDKLLLVQSLHQKGQVVAVMGTRTAELPSLREADVSIFMGTNSSEMAKESCDIIISNGNFASIVDVLIIGKSNYLNIRKYLQLELTTNISGIRIIFITTISLGDTPITPFQLFLVNLTVGTLGALALLTEPPTQDVLEMRPINQTQNIVSMSMRRNVFVQVCYQGVVLLVFQFIEAQDFLRLMDPKVKKAMIFNGFVLCLVFNQFNTREPEKENVFKGIIGSRWFLVSVGAPIILEVLLIEFAERVTGFPRLNILQWLACFLFAIMSCPIDYAAKYIWSFLANRPIDLPRCLSSIGFSGLGKMQWLARILFAILLWPIDYAVKCISSFFADNSVGLPSCLSSTSPFESKPLTSPSQLPTPTMNV